MQILRYDQQEHKKIISRIILGDIQSSRIQLTVNTSVQFTLYTF